MNDQTAEPGANPVPRYSTLMIAIHWSTAILVVVAYTLSEGGPTIRLDPPLLANLLSYPVTLFTSLVCCTITEPENAVSGTPWPNCADSN